MTDDKGCLYGKYIHKLTWDLDGCVNECPKCAFDKGRKAERERCLAIVNRWRRIRSGPMAQNALLSISDEIGGQDAK